MERDAAPHSVGLGSEIRNFWSLLGGDAAYDVPYLQRGYEWADAEVSAMAGDLHSASEGGYTSYFLGHIVGVKNARGGIDIVDGQQRLVTTTILFAFLRDRLSSHAPRLAAQLQHCIEGPARARVRPRISDAAFLNEWIQTPGRFEDCCKLATPGKDGAPATFDSDAQAQMVQAALTIRAQFSKLAYEALEKLANFILDRAVVDYIIAEDRSMAAILYRGMNMRGKQLSPADLIKLEAIEAANLDDESKEAVARTWEAAEERLRSDNFSFLLEILPLIVSRHTTLRPGDLTEWSRNALQSGDARVVLEQMLPLYAEVFEEILDGDVRLETRNSEDKAAHREVNGLIRGLLFLQQDRQWIAPAIAAVNAHRGRPQFLAQFFRGLDRLTFACFLDGIQPADRNERFAEVVRAGADPARLDHVFALKREEVNMIGQRLRQQFRRDSWRRRAVAARVNAALDITTAFRPSEDITVEHVAPRTQNNAWRAVGWGAAQVASSANLIGNFVLVPKIVNGTANRKPLAEKLKLIFAEDAPPALPLTQQIFGVETWTEQGVRDRTERLARRLMEDWDLA